MPMYEMKCAKCEVIHDVLVSLDEADNDIQCPECKSKLIKLISAPYFTVR